MDKIPYCPGNRKRFVQQFFINPHANPFPSNPEPLYYAVYRIGYGCYGTGITRDGALEKGRYWLNADMADLPDYSPDMRPGTLCMVRVTLPAFYEIERNGGCMRLLTIENGTLTAGVDHV